jgi:hypothetical protein
MLVSSSLHTLSRRSRRLSRAQGFTLVEVACAAFVLLFGIASSIVAMQSGFRSLDYARGLTLSSQILQSEIEAIRLLPWGQVKALPETPPEKLPLVDLDTVFEDAPRPHNFKIYHAFEDVIAGQMLRITVTASWTTLDGITHRRSTSTEYCIDGLNDFYATKH